MSTGTFIGPSKGKERRWDYQQCILVMVANGQDGQSSRNMLGGVGNRVTKSCERSIGPQRPAPYCEPHRQAFRRSTKFGFDVRLTISNRIWSWDRGKTSLIKRRLLGFGAHSSSCRWTKPRNWLIRGWQSDCCSHRDDSAPPTTVIKAESRSDDGHVTLGRAVPVIRYWDVEMTECNSIKDTSAR